MSEEIINPFSELERLVKGMQPISAEPVFDYRIYKHLLNHKDVLSQVKIKQNKTKLK